jgi:hypothetical protein
MSRGTLVVAAAVAALTVSAPASADQAKSVTATGAAQEKVTPKDRKSNASINAAVDAARAKGIAGAMAEAREYALKYARAANLTLGAIVSVSDAQSNGFGYYGGPGFFGPFGPNQFCGTVSQPVIKVVGGKRKRVGSKRVHRCFVPPFEISTLTVTYSAS